MRKPKRRSLYIYMTILLIIINTIALSWYAAYVQNLTIEQCFSILDDSREQVGQMIANEMQMEQEHLESASLLLADLMDVMMPVLNGIEATKQIRALDREDAKTIPIIALTANAFAEDIEKCKEAGMNAHLSKPIDLEKMLAAIRKLCRNFPNRLAK